MGKNQGVNRLKSGYIRKLTNSEKNRRYVYITMDANSTEVINKEFELFINNVHIGTKKLDKFGRITGMTELVMAFDNKDIHFQTIDGNLYIKY